ncbi:hypothetical protein P171DRAFT_179796 [Karstenula rhodostoma CBS 690.94]|uniref:Uncharacterized protein n=1 Tax=Karstenula rhodostoma CBS 690.94 TaxID=1392251 RepID=A0A9P4P6W8_9PLEO|nr:hypothetical protein P171DRAFT_179796 [Karstenula rhodostoma CBS 690.94]
MRTSQGCPARYHRASIAPAPAPEPRDWRPRRPTAPPSVPKCLSWPRPLTDGYSRRRWSQGDTPAERSRPEKQQHLYDTTWEERLQPWSERVRYGIPADEHVARCIEIPPVDVQFLCSRLSGSTTGSLRFGAQGVASRLVATLGVARTTNADSGLRMRSWDLLIRGACVSHGRLWRRR